MTAFDPTLQAVLDRFQDRRRTERDQPADAQGRDMRMYAIGPEAGMLLNVLARSLKAPRILEIGSSFGYSGLWLAEAARAIGGHVITIEKEAYKSEHAKTEAAAAGLSDWIEHRTGDALEVIGTLDGPFDMVFLDLWKDLYLPCFHAVMPKLRPGAILVADNMVRGGGSSTTAYADAVRAHADFTSVMLPVGTGMEVSRYLQTYDHSR
jgi:predicted O-methyltransferase YrrM